MLDGMAEAISDLRSAQDEFNKASDVKINAKTNKGASATSFRKPIIACVNEKLVPYLSAVRDTEGYADFADKIQAEIAAVNALATKRGKKGGAAAGSTVAGEVSPNLNLPKYACPACKAQIIGEHRYCTRT